MQLYKKNRCGTGAVEDNRLNKYENNPFHRTADKFINKFTSFLDLKVVGRLFQWAWVIVWIGNIIYQWR